MLAANLSLDELRSKVQCLLGKDRLITIAYTATSPKQAADISRRLGLEESIVKSIRYAAIIKRDFGNEIFSEVFAPYKIITLPSCFSGLKLKLKFYDPRKGGHDFLNSVELSYVTEEIKKLLEKLHVEYEIDEIQAPSWLGNRVTKQYSKG